MVRRSIFIAAAFWLAGCLYLPAQKPMLPERAGIVLPLPFDKVWDALNKVVVKDGYKVKGSDPQEGILEVQSNHFTLKEADCGEIKGLGANYLVTPESDSTVVFSFDVEPHGGEATLIAVRSQFGTPADVPLREPVYVQCVSRGGDERRLVRQTAKLAASMHRPVYQKWRDPKSESTARASSAGR